MRPNPSIARAKPRGMGVGTVALSAFFLKMAQALARPSVVEYALTTKTNAMDPSDPEAVCTRKGEVEEERIDNVLPATSSCLCVPHSCIKDGGLNSRKSGYYRTVCSGLRAFFIGRRSPINLGLADRTGFAACFLPGHRVDQRRSTYFGHSEKNKAGR